MAEIQSLALDLFRRDGFDAVTVEHISTEAGTSPSTLYRYFGTKEGIVLWDDFDGPVGKAIVRRLMAGDSARQAVCEAFCTALADGLAKQGNAHMKRIRFIYDTPQVHGAAIKQQIEDVAALADGLRDMLQEDDDGFTAEVLAGACYAAMDCAIKRWVDSEGATPLNELMRAAFDALQWRGETDPKQEDKR